MTTASILHSLLSCAAHEQCVLLPEWTGSTFPPEKWYTLSPGKSLVRACSGKRCSVCTAIDPLENPGKSWPDRKSVVSLYRLYLHSALASTNRALTRKNSHTRALVRRWGSGTERVARLVPMYLPG